MATSAGEVEVKLTLNSADFNRLLKQNQQDVNVFGKALDGFAGKLIAAFSFYKIAAFFKDSLDAYAAQELALNKLTHALENQGIASSATLHHLTAFSTELMNLTGVQDELINESQATLVTFGLQGATLDRATKAALDMSAAMGIDLAQATMLVGKAFEGNTAMLSRYGIKISEAIDPSKKFEVVLGQINQRFGGAAVSQAQTFAGQMKLLGSTFGELQEAIGGALSKGGFGFITWLTDMLRFLTTIVQGMENMKSTIMTIANLLQTYIVTMLGNVLSTLLMVIQKMYEIGAHLPVIGGLFATLASKVGGVNENLQAEILKFQLVKLAGIDSAAKTAQAHKEAAEVFNNVARQRMDMDATMNKWIADHRMKDREDFMKDTDERTKVWNDFANAFITTEADMWAFGTEQVNGFFKNVGDAYARMVMQGKSFADTMKAVFRSMAEAFISYVAQMIAKWLAFMALKAATGGAGGFGGGGFGFMAEGGVIAEPSIITGLQSGRQIIAGESGPEAVVPMGKNMTTGELAKRGGGGGGGTVNIHISGTFLEADANTWQRLMREKVIPEIRRFTMSSPTGPFARRRGVV